MRQNLSDQVIYRSILVGLVVMLLGISARPHAVESMFIKAWQLKEHAPLYASAALGEITGRYPWRKELRLIAAHLALKAGEPHASIQFFEGAAAESHLDPVDWIGLGDAYQMAGDLPSAEEAWLKAIQIDPALPQVYTRLYELHTSAHDYQSSANDLKALLQIQPSLPENYYRLGLLLAATQPEAALVYLEQAADMGQEFSASAAEISRRISSARLNDEPTYLFIAAGRALAAQDEWELASEAFRQALRLRPDYAEAWAFLGESLQHFNLEDAPPDPEAGLYELMHAFTLNTSSMTANLLLSLYWQRQGEYDQALQYINNALAVDGDNPVLHTEAGRLLALTGDLGSAQASFEKAIELAPDDPTYWRMLANFSLQNQIQLKEIALPATRQAILLNPHDAQSLDLMGKVYLALGDDVTASRFIHQALRNDPLYAPAYLHLGIIYLNQGESYKARQQFVLAEQLADDGTVIDQAQRMLEYYFP